MQFDLYQSGIKQASFYIDNEQISISQLGSTTVSLSDEENDHFAGIIKTAPRELFDQFVINSQLDFSKSPLVLGDDRRFEQTSVDSFWIERNKKPATNLIVQDNAVVGFQITIRNQTIVLVQPGFEALTVLSQWQAAGMLNDHPFSVKSQTTEFVEMTDGTKLATEVFLPDDNQSTHSTILVRTPYGRQMSYADQLTFIQRGYAFVVQDVRGRNDSDGEWLPMYYERDDGKDTIEWIASQEWSNQRVGMIGGSYLGYVQWAAAASGTPYLKALVSMVTSGGAFSDTIYRNGAPISGSSAWFFATDEKRFNPARMMRDDWAKLLKVRPLKNIPVVGLGHEIPGFTKLMEHKTNDELLQNMDWLARADKITVPALIQSGWFDDNGIGTTEAIRATDDYPQGTRKIILGPWVHSGNAQYDLGPIHLGENALRFDIDLLHLQWLDHFLNGAENGVEKGPTLEYYTINQDKWRTADGFPPTDQTASLYLDANDGSLKKGVPSEPASVSYAYDPQDPTPHLIDISANELEFPNDYTEVEKRSDVVSFTTETLAEPLTITGWFKVHFFASSSAVDTDWVVRLTDVTPDGQSLNITDSTMNAKFRNSSTAPEFLEPGKIYEFEIETQKTSIALLPGHRLRLDIASAADNLIFPNSNTKDGANSEETVVAEQTIYTGGEWESRVEFWVDEQ